MSANTAAGAISRFLTTSPETSSSGSLIERLANVLQPYGDQGVELSQAVELAGLSKADFFTALSSGQSAALLEMVPDGDGTKVRLTPAGRSVF